MIPQLRDWYRRYEASGFTVVGVHTPEFSWERSYDAVAAAVRELSISYPVVQDNDRVVWKRYGVWGWPTAFLVDKRGVVRYQHIGEGGYVDTEEMIRRLLAE